MVSPSGQPVNSLIMMAVPETPPGAIFEGAKKRLRLTASRSPPMVRSRQSRSADCRSRRQISALAFCLIECALAPFESAGLMETQSSRV